MSLKLNPVIFDDNLSSPSENLKDLYEKPYYGVEHRAGNLFKCK